MFLSCSKEDNSALISQYERQLSNFTTQIAALNNQVSDLNNQLNNIQTENNDLTKVCQMRVVGSVVNSPKNEIEDTQFYSAGDIIGVKFSGWSPIQSNLHAKPRKARNTKNNILI